MGECVHDAAAGELKSASVNLNKLYRAPMGIEGKQIFSVKTQYFRQRTSIISKTKQCFSGKCNVFTRKQISTFPFIKYIFFTWPIRWLLGVDNF